MATLNLPEILPTLPPGLRKVAYLGNNSVEMLALYFECFEVHPASIDHIVMVCRAGHVTDLAVWAAEVAARYTVTVTFELNGRQLTAFPSAAAACLSQWEKQQ